MKVNLATTTTISLYTRTTPWYTVVAAEGVHPKDSENEKTKQEHGYAHVYDDDDYFTERTRVFQWIFIHLLSRGNSGGRNQEDRRTTQGQGRNRRGVEENKGCRR